jgi:hypothetical protein
MIAIIRPRFYSIRRFADPDECSPSIQYEESMYIHMGTGLVTSWGATTVKSISRQNPRIVSHLPIIHQFQGEIWWFFLTRPWFYSIRRLAEKNSLVPTYGFTLSPRRVFEYTKKTRNCSWLSLDWYRPLPDEGQGGYNRGNFLRCVRVYERRSHTLYIYSQTRYTLQSSR